MHEFSVSNPIDQKIKQLSEIVRNNHDNTIYEEYHEILNSLVDSIPEGYVVLIDRFDVIKNNLTKFMTIFTVFSTEYLKYYTTSPNLIENVKLSIVDYLS